jgi:hypothetical protein
VGTTGVRAERIALLGFTAVRAPLGILTSIVALGLLSVPVSADVHRGSGPCDLRPHGSESVRSLSRRLIRCAAERWEVSGGPERAICIADAESGLDPEATSDHGAYLGLYQHSAKAWPERYETWTREGWELDESALSGRTNAIVTIRMVNANGWGAWEEVEGC